MITEDQKNAFKTILGSHYSRKVIAVLKERGVKDTFGKTHSSKMVVQVMNGETAHVLIEDAIMYAVENQLRENKKIARKRNKLLKSIQ